MKDVNIALIDERIQINGVLTANTVEYALAQTKPLIPYDDTTTIQLDGVLACDSAGLAFLTAILREAKRKRTKLLFHKIPKQILDLSRVSGLDGLLVIAP